MLTDTVKDNGIIFDEQEIRQLVEVVIEECKNGKVAKDDCLGDVTISYLEMKALLEKQAGLAVAIGTRKVAQGGPTVFYTGNGSRLRVGIPNKSAMAL